MDGLLVLNVVPKAKSFFQKLWELVWHSFDQALVLSQHSCGERVGEVQEPDRFSVRQDRSVQASGCPAALESQLCRAASRFCDGSV